MKRIAPLLIGVLIVTVFTVAITLYSDERTGRRGGEFRGIEEVRAALKTLPLEIDGAVGTWVAEGERSLDRASIVMLRIQDSYIFRTYTNTITQEEVHLTLMAGPTGRITVHTPEVCFGNRDVERETERTRVPFNVQLASGEEIEDMFWRIDFVGRTLDMNNRFTFYWAVSTGGPWEARNNPRGDFRAYRFVYRIQVEASFSLAKEGDAISRFLADALPTIHEHLRPCQ